MWNVDPRKVKYVSSIYICLFCTADSRGPAAGAKERSFSQLPKFILINCKHITPAFHTHLVTSASHTEALQGAEGSFTCSWANSSLLHPCRNFRFLSLIQLLHLPWTSPISTRSHLKTRLWSWDPQETTLLPSTIYNLFDLFLLIIYLYTHTDILIYSATFGDEYKHLTANFAYIPFPVSQFLLSAETQHPLPQTNIKSIRIGMCYFY